MNIDEPTGWYSRVMIGVFVGVCACGVLLTTRAAQEGVAVPTVRAARVPLYPPDPQGAHIEGVVRLQVTTDGKGVAAVEALSGQPMLARAAIENIKTWEFEEHRATVFVSTFRYRLLPVKCDAACRCDSIEKPTITLRLPSEVEISDKEGRICDLASGGQ